MPQKEHFPLIRTIYLYLFSIVGLAIVITGCIRALEMGLKTFVFKDAYKQEEIDYSRPTSVYPLENVEKLQGNESLTEADKTAIRDWLNNYKKWKTENDSFNRVSAQRQKEAASILASLVVGFPLYIYHWSVIKKETKERKNSIGE